MRKRWKRRRKEEDGEKVEGERWGKWKDLASQIRPITETFRSQFLQKTLAALPQSLSLTHCALRLSALFFFVVFFSILSYDPSGVTIGEVLPAVCFPSVCECSLLQHPGSCEPALEHLRTLCSHVEEQKAFSWLSPTPVKTVWVFQAYMQFVLIPYRCSFCVVFKPWLLYCSVVNYL